MISVAPISIAMATFNGERYLAEQLESIAAQTSLPLELVVCDDGSTDDTIEILERFAANAPFPVHIHRNETQLGCADNFLKAAKLCTGEWIGYCDQDDVWLPQKLETLARRIAADPSLFMIVHSAVCTDARLNPLGKRFPDFVFDQIVEPTTLISSWAGFATVFRAELLAMGKALRRPSNPWDGTSDVWHDGWVYLLASVFGDIACLSQTLALYRRHDDTVTAWPQSKRTWKLALPARICADSYIKERHYSQWSDTLASASFENEEFIKLASNAAKAYARMADIHRRRRAMFEAPGNRFAHLLRSAMKADYGNRSKGGHRCCDLPLDIYRLAFFGQENPMDLSRPRGGFSDPGIVR